MLCRLHALNLSRYPPTSVPHLHDALKQRPPTEHLFTAAGWTRLGLPERTAGFDWHSASTKTNHADDATDNDAKDLLQQCVRFLQTQGPSQDYAEAIANAEELLRECPERDQAADEAEQQTAALALSQLSSIISS